MKTILYPIKKNWQEILQRPVIDKQGLIDRVKPILADVKSNGDEAVKRYTLQFDKVAIDSLEVSQEEIDDATRLLPSALRKAIDTAAENIRRFHEKQCMQTEIIETMPGIKCWRRSVAIEKVGLYIPGGTALLFSTVLMLGIPAKIAGCMEIVLTTPPTKENNTIHPAILYTAQLVGITRVFKAGGVQAIAAMAYGTETVPKVYKIFGPGNQYVNCAKQLVQVDGLAIDMPAGPSEVCVMADDTCNPSYVAADLLSQAEHGTDSQVLLVCANKDIVEKVSAEIEKQVKDLPRRDMIAETLKNSSAIVLQDSGEMIELVNEYAPEHLIIATWDAKETADKIINAGSVFIGNYSPESAGDYASGTNHTLPTNGFARSYSGVSVDSFVKKITYQEITKEGLQRIGETVEQMAAAEGLDAHKNAITIRLK
ncbi:MAG: histidinol dehydrogenase [Bacteroidetes bacterium]|nr:MAG: histidinol dehydrogenase [Bacteroidota bacterium]